MIHTPVDISHKKRCSELKWLIKCSITSSTSRLNFRPVVGSAPLLCNSVHSTHQIFHFLTQIHEFLTMLFVIWNQINQQSFGKNQLCKHNSLFLHRSRAYYVTQAKAIACTAYSCIRLCRREANTGCRWYYVSAWLLLTTREIPGVEFHAVCETLATTCTLWVSVWNFSQNV